MSPRLVGPVVPSAAGPFFISFKFFYLLRNFGTGPSSGSQSCPSNRQHVDELFAIAKAADPVVMANAFRLGVEAGRTAYEAGLMEARDFASPSTPVIGTPFWHAVS